MSPIGKVILVLVLGVVGYLLLPYVKIDKKPASNQNQSNNNSNDPVKTFTSEDLALRFKYNTDQDADGKPDTAAEQVGDKVYVYYTAAAKESGQWVQKFSKDANETLEDSIKRQFLQNYDSKDCYALSLADYYKSYDVTAPQLPDNVAEAVIAYPKATDPNDPFWKNSEKCPKDYSATNGLSYFYMDKNHADKFYFFSIGQYGIAADAKNQQAWQDTFEVIK